MQNDGNSKNTRFHFNMLEKYYDLFQSIETETLSPSFLSSLEEQITQLSQLSTKEKEVHQNFISQIRKMSEEIKTLHWMSNHLKVLHELGQTFSQTFDKEQIYKKAYELVSRVMDADAFVIALYQEGDKEFSIPFSMDNGVRYESLIMPLGQGIISKVLISKESIHLKTEKDVHGHDNYIQWGNPEKNTDTCIFVPMILNNQIKGVISAQNYREFAYGSEHEELLRIIGIQVASAIETAILYDKVYDMSIKDDLTNIKNNRKFHLDLEEKMSQASEEQPVILMMLDSDNLKMVNDRYGHHVGDELIKLITEALLHHLNDGEEAYRYAGDEFMIISPNSTIDKVKEKALKIQQYLKENPLEHEGHQINTTISIGIAKFPTQTTNADELKRLADEAMYQSKKKGKNQITVY
jgi:diguanylate cyclase (GGDEF)-like protein